MITDTIQVKLGEDVIFEFDVEFHKGTEAKVSGLPEDCYPAEPPHIISQTLISITIMGGMEELPLDCGKHLWSTYADEINDMVMDELCNY